MQNLRDRVVIDFADLPQTLRKQSDEVKKSSVLIQYTPCTVDSNNYNLFNVGLT